MMQANDYIKIRVEDFEQPKDEMFEDWMFQRAAADRMEQAIYEAREQLDLLSMVIDVDKLELDESQTGGFVRIMENISRNLTEAVSELEIDHVKAAIENFKGQMPGQTE